MQILEIKVGELVGFTAGDLWKQLSPKPITDLRALSQSLNPRAKPDDVALVVAFENGILLGLVGLMPDCINGNPDQPICSNSCWWAHPEKGKHIAVPLFLKAFSLCSQRLFMTDCTPHTIEILGKTNLFDFPETTSGIRGFLKFNFHELVPAKFPATHKLRPILNRADQILNFPVALCQKIYASKFLKNGPQIEYPVSLNPELKVFIKQHSENEFTRRSADDLEWIRQFPWIKRKTSATLSVSMDYPFSYLTVNFVQYFVKITDQGRLVGLLFISVRDGHMRVPYTWFDDKNTDRVLMAIYRQALLKNATALSIFNPRLAILANATPHPFLFKKKIIRLMAISKQLSDNYHRYPEIQDGDGDVVFT